MSQPTLQAPHEPLAVMEPDDLDSVPAARRPEVAASVHPFAGFGLQPGYSKRDRLIISTLAFAYAAYSLVTRLQTVFRFFPRR